MAEDAVDRWVRQLNALARQLEEDTHAIHPSAWKEALGPDMERWKRLAKSGPKEEV